MHYIITTCCRKMLLQWAELTTGHRRYRRTSYTCTRNERKKIKKWKTEIQTTNKWNNSSRYNCWWCRHKHLVSRTLRGRWIADLFVLVYVLRSTTWPAGSIRPRSYVSDVCITYNVRRVGSCMNTSLLRTCLPNAIYLLPGIRNRTALCGQHIVPESNLV